MAYKSKEQYPLITNPSKKTYCHVDPRLGRPCRVHFHKQSLATMSPADIADFGGEIETSIWDEGLNWEANDSFYIAGYEKTTLTSEFGIPYDELHQMETFPAAHNVSKPVTAESELWNAYSDRSRREYMDKDVQVVVLAKKLEEMDKPLRELREQLDKERKNPAYPGNNKLGSDLPKSQEYYKLIGKQHEMMTAMSEMYISAAYAMGIDSRNSNSTLARAVMMSPMHTTMTQKDPTDGLERTYWSTDFTQLIHAVNDHARRPQVIEKYNKEAERYSDTVVKGNQMIKQYGTDFRSQPVKPSEALIAARVEERIQKSLLQKAQQELASSNLFNRSKRKKTVSDIEGTYNVAKSIRESKERTD